MRSLEIMMLCIALGGCAIQCAGRNDGHKFDSGPQHEAAHDFATSEQGQLEDGDRLSISAGEITQSRLLHHG
jgi:hypothetical protein